MSNNVNRPWSARPGSRENVARELNRQRLGDAQQLERVPANPQFCCQLCGRGLDFGCNCPGD